MKRNLTRRALALAVAALMGVTAKAQELPPSSLPTRPMPEVFTPPGEAKEMRDADANVKPAAVWNVKPGPAGIGGRPVATPSFAGMGAGSPTSANANAPVWNVTPSGNGREASMGAPGRGWKSPVMSGVSGGSAAVMGAPRSAGPRPEWNWHGYDGYNQNRPAAGVPAMSAATAADLAPFMKYAHMWRPASAGVAMPLPVTAAPDAPASLPVLQTSADNSGRWTGYGSITSSPGNVAPPPVRPLLPAPASEITTARDTVVQPSAPATGLAQLRERVAQICAGRCRNLVIESTGPNQLRISFVTRDNADADALTDALAVSQDLAAYKVDYEIQIGQ